MLLGCKYKAYRLIFPACKSSFNFQFRQMPQKIILRSPKKSVCFVDALAFILNRDY